MTKTPSPYAHVYLALAEDKDVQLQVRYSHIHWQDRSKEDVLNFMADGVPPENIRVKPATIGGNRYSFESNVDRDAAINAICALLEGRE